MSGAAVTYQARCGTFNGPGAINLRPHSLSSLIGQELRGSLTRILCQREAELSIKFMAESNLRILPSFRFDLSRCATKKSLEIDKREKSDSQHSLLKKVLLWSRLHHCSGGSL